MIGFSAWLLLSHAGMTGYQCVKRGEAQTTLQESPAVARVLFIFSVGIIGISLAVIMSVFLK